MLLGYRTSREPQAGEGKHRGEYWERLLKEVLDPVSS